MNVEKVCKYCSKINNCSYKKSGLVCNDLKSLRQQLELTFKNNEKAMVILPFRK